MPQILENIGCPYCGCSCDDVRITISDDGQKILEVDNACAIGTQIFLKATNHERIIRPRIRQPDGSIREITYAEAFDYSAKTIIAAKKHPDIWVWINHLRSSTGCSKAHGNWWWRS